MSKPNVPRSHKSCLRVRNSLDKCNDTILNSWYHKLHMDPTKDQTDQPKVVPNNQDVVSSATPSVGGPSKEVEPSSQNLVSPSEKGMEISAELKEIGVEEVSKTPQLTPEQTAIGVRVSDKPVEKVATPAPGSFQSPLTQAEMVTAKKSKISDAIAWLSNTILRQIKRSKFNQRQSLQKPI